MVVFLSVVMEGLVLQACTNALLTNIQCCFNVFARRTVANILLCFSKAGMCSEEASARWMFGLVLPACTTEVVDANAFGLFFLIRIEGCVSAFVCAAPMQT